MINKFNKYQRTNIIILQINNNIPYKALTFYNICTN